MIWDSVLNARACRTSDTRGSLELRDRSAAPSGSRRHIPRPASASSVPDQSTADPWTNNEVQVRCGARKDREQYRSSVPDDLQGLRHRAEIGRKAALVRSSGVPSWLAPTKIRVSKMESRFAASLNGLLQQNRHEADVASGWSMSVTRGKSGPKTEAS